MDSNRTLTEIEAADYLGISRSTLRQGRMNGPRSSRCPTPPFIRLGRKILYLREDLDQLLKERRILPIHSVKNEGANNG